MKRLDAVEWMLACSRIPNGGNASRSCASRTRSCGRRWACPPRATASPSRSWPRTGPASAAEPSTRRRACDESLDPVGAEMATLYESLGLMPGLFSGEALRIVPVAGGARRVALGGRPGAGARAAATWRRPATRLASCARTPRRPRRAGLRRARCATTWRRSEAPSYRRGWRSRARSATTGQAVPPRLDAVPGRVPAAAGQFLRSPRALGWDGIALVVRGPRREHLRHGPAHARSPAARPSRTCTRRLCSWPGARCCWRSLFEAALPRRASRPRARAAWRSWR